MKLEEIERKLSAARTRLIIDKPFLGALTLRLPLQAASSTWCETTATDARKFYYNPEYIDQLTLAQTQFILAHEALHCALSHFARRQHRIKQRWDVACDYAVNPLLVNDGLTPPPNALLEDSYRGMTAEEIYPFIEENPEECTLDKHLYDNQEDGGQSDKDPSQNAQNEKDIQQQQQSQSSSPQQRDRQRSGQGNHRQPNDSREPDNSPERSNSDANSQPQPNQGAAHDKSTQPSPQQSEHPRPRRENIPAPLQQNDQNQGQTQNEQQPAQSPLAMQAPAPLSEQEREELKVQWQQRLAGAAQQAMQAGKLGGAMARLVDHLLQPQLPWRSLLAHYITCSARDDYSYVRPNTRRGNPAIFPGLRSDEISIAVVLDTSGSIKPNEMREFLSEINAIKSQLRARIIFHACDAAMAADGPWIFEAWQEFKLPQAISGGGATDFRPAFEWLQSLDVAPNLLIYFTDAEGSFPESCPTFPVIWLVKGRLPVPWGQRVQLN